MLPINLVVNPIGASMRINPRKIDLTNLIGPDTTPLITFKILLAVLLIPSSSESKVPFILLVQRGTTLNTCDSRQSCLLLSISAFPGNGRTKPCPVGNTLIRLLPATNTLWQRVAKLLPIPVKLLGRALPALPVQSGTETSKLLLTPELLIPLRI